MTKKLTETFNLVPMSEMKDDKEVTVYREDENEEETFKKIDENLDRLVEVSNAAVSQLYEIAYSSQQSRDYETLSKMIKVAADVNKDKMQIRKDKKEIEGEKEEEPKQVHNTLVFNGSTADLLEQLKEIKEK
jgi:hypothetical protein